MPQPLSEQGWVERTTSMLELCAARAQVLVLDAVLDAFLDAFLARRRVAVQAAALLPLLGAQGRWVQVLKNAMARPQAKFLQAKAWKSPLA